MIMTAECIYCTFNQVDRGYMAFEQDEARRTVFLQKVCREIGGAQEGIMAPELLERILPLIAEAAG